MLSIGDNIKHYNSLKIQSVILKVAVASHYGKIIDQFIQLSECEDCRQLVVLCSNMDVHFESNYDGTALMTNERMQMMMSNKQILPYVCSESMNYIVNVDDLKSSLKGVSWWLRRVHDRFYCRDELVLSVTVPE